MTHAFPRRLSSLTAGLTGLTCLFTLAPSQADDRLGPINITAAREAPAIAPAMPETVITREEIERSQAYSLEKLLAGRSGLNVTNQGGPGKVSNVSIWGQNARNTAIFIDGMRIGSVSLGQAYIEHIPLAQIERIEIVRGPRSGQWGADAGGGVIQIFTRRGQKEGSRVTGGFGAGSRGQRSFDATVSGQKAAVDYSIGVAHRETDGFDAQSAPGTNADDDGYLNDSVNMKIGYRFNGGGYMRGHMLASSAEVDFDGAFQDTTEIEQRTFGLSSSTGRIGFWQLRTRAGRHIDDQDYYKSDVFSSRFDTQRDTLFLANDFFIGPSTTVTLGADQTYDKLSSNFDYDEKARRNQALFVQANTQLGEKLDIQTALRRDFNDRFGTANTGSLDLAYALTEGWTLTAGHGTAFTAPTFAFLFDPESGNADLQPEESRTTRAGVNWRRGMANFGLTAFQSRVRDFISSGDNPVNVARSEIRGIEMENSLRLDNWEAGLSITYLSTENEDTGERLPRQPRWNGRIDVDRNVGAFSVGATLRGRSGSMEPSSPNADNDGFVTADLRGAYQINADWRIEARVENLFDREYQLVRSYNQAPRGVFVSLRYGR